MNVKKIDILLVDDHKMFLEGITAILSDVETVNIVGTARNGEDALKLIPNVVPQVLMTDIDMPIINGIELTKRVKALYPMIKIIAVSSHINSTTIASALKAGVNGYILKNTGRIELLKAIEVVAKGLNYFNDEVKNILSNSIFNGKATANNTVHLSDREKEVLTFISNEKSSQEIAEILYLSINTVETHRKNLMRKIGTKNMVGLVKYAIQQGIID